MGAAAEREILFPLKRGSRTPKEFEDAVKTVLDDRDPEVWTVVTPPPDPQQGTPPRDRSDEDSCQ